MTFSVTGKIVRVDRLGFFTPLRSPVVEKTNQFFFLAIYADTRPTSSQKGISLTDKVLELLVSIRMWFGVQPFDIAFGTNVLLIEQPSDCFATQPDSLLLMQSRFHLVDALADPA